MTWWHSGHDTVIFWSLVRKTPSKVSFAEQNSKMFICFWQLLTFCYFWCCSLVFCGVLVKFLVPQQSMFSHLTSCKVYILMKNCGGCSKKFASFSVFTTLSRFTEKQISYKYILPIFLIQSHTRQCVLSTSGVCDMKL